MKQPLTQIHICSTAVSLSPLLRSAHAAKPILLLRHCCCLDVSSASLPPMPSVPVIQVGAVTVAALSILPFLLLTLLPSKVRSSTVLSQLLLPSCHSFCHKSFFASLMMLSLPSCCRLTASLPSLPSQVFSATVVLVLTLLSPLCRHYRQVL